MKKSIYNHFFNLNNQNVLAFNALRGSFAVMTRREYETYRQLASNRETKVQHGKDVSKLQDDLYKGGFIIDNEVDEKAILKTRNRITRFGSRDIALTIVPTMDCNFRCIYCFQHRNRTYMSPKIENAIIKYCKQEIKNGSRKIGVMWYGGEPLLPRARKIVFRLSERLLKLSNEREVDYVAGIVTNGSLLTKTVAERLKEFHCGSAQVTLDGPPEAHNKRRHFRNGSGSFDIILKNLQASCNLLKINIRVNVDKENADSVLELLNILEETNLKEKVNLYFAPVEPYTTLCTHIEGTCYRRRDFAVVQVRLYSYAQKKGFKITPYPFSRPHACGAECLNTLLIEPEGYLQKCWNCTGMKEEIVGHITDIQENRHYEYNLTKWLGYDIFAERVCSSCNILPICMGSCLHKKLGIGKEGLECPTWKYNLEEMLKIYYQQWKLSKSEQKN